MYLFLRGGRAAVHRLWVVFIYLSYLSLSTGQYFLEVMLLSLFGLVFFLIGSSLRAASVWRKEIEISKGQNKQFSFLLYIRRTITLLY